MNQVGKNKNKQINKILAGEWSNRAGVVEMFSRADSHTDTDRYIQTHLTYI